DVQSVTCPRTPKKVSHPASSDSARARLTATVVSRLRSGRPRFEGAFVVIVVIVAEAMQRARRGGVEPGHDKGYSLRRNFCGPSPNFLIQRQTAARCLPSSRETSATLPS